MNKSIVALSRCENYDYANVKKSVEDVLKTLGGWKAVLPPAPSVLVKPNLLSARVPEKGVTTHPSVVRAVCESLIEYGVTPSLGDSPAGAHKGVMRVYENTGMKAVCDELGVKMISFEQSGAGELVPNTKNV
jgi:uncharacterized protein (DUF362 family)